MRRSPLLWIGISLQGAAIHLRQPPGLVMRARPRILPSGAGYLSLARKQQQQQHSRRGLATSYGGWSRIVRDDLDDPDDPGRLNPMATSIGMVEQPFFQVDAFTSRPFGGNPAAVVAMDGRGEEMFPSVEAMLAIAGENNLSETAFFGKLSGGGEGDYSLRWFTPKVEVDMCGHATLATAHVIFSQMASLKTISFHTRSGILKTGINSDGLIEMQLPAQSKDAMPEMLNEVGDAIGCMPLEVHWRQGQRHGLAILPAPSDVQALSPDMHKVSSLPFGGIICAAKGTPIGEPEGTLDFVYRYFAPGSGIPEDAATGSAQCSLVPYYSSRLGLDRLRSSQLSSRRADFDCVFTRGDGEGTGMVVVSGHAVTVIKGTILVPDA